MTTYGRSPWLEQFPRSRVRSFPRLREPLTTDVAIIGGGLTGCATAYALAAAGVKVVLLEAGQVGRSSSAAAFGWLSETPETSFHALEQASGLRAARRAWQAWRRAALDCTALLRRLDVKCALTPQQTVWLARTPEQAAALRREAKARRAAGLDAVLLDAGKARQASGVDALAGLRTRDGGAIDPYRATIGLAAAADARGARIFEGAAVTKTRAGARTVDVVTADATVTAYRVVVATGRPTELFRPLARHVKVAQTYFALTAPVPARIRRSLAASTALPVSAGAQPATPAVVTRDLAEPPHVVRWVDGDRVLVSGADGPLVPERSREKVIVQRTGQLMYELSTLYPEISGLAPANGWHAVYGATADGLPFIGPHRNFPRHLFAFGGGAHSSTEAYLASRILLRHYLGETDAVDEVFGFTRVTA